MKKFLFLMSLLVVFLFFGFKVVRQNVKNDLAAPVSLPSPTPIQTSIKNVKGVRSADIKKSIFVPYWGLNGEDIEDKYDSYLYFGVVPTRSGINKKEAGYIGIDKFLKVTPKSSEKKLVIRMLDPDITFPVLKDTAAQKVVIRDSLRIAIEHGFSGVVLDLEVSAVPFDSLIKQINEFSKLFYEESKDKDLGFAIMFYGDTFYRIRPFDIKALSANADEFLIMSYDFSKSRGNPGPNFPLRGKEVYGYDMTTMIDDFSRYLPDEKTTIVFGLYGYDWEVDDKGNAVGTGEAKSYQKISKEFLGKCEYKECSVKSKNDSRETEIRYTDSENKKHIVWFEDMESVSAKQNFLKAKGISNFSFWAYSYF
ncbi:MAG TPA: glycosyl hydrolase family 18 protein [Candidatus Limnocylindrales bacterium]|nr:glycosyl hydrolase family 18 protein [Candidatus Limnocylindrales bacterium]